MKIDLDDKTDVLTYHKKLLAEVEKEKEDLKAKIEKWHNSSKNLSILLNSQMSANDKFGLGYGDFRSDGILSYENEVLQSVFMNKESDLDIAFDYPHRALQNKGIVDSGCSRHHGHKSSKVNNAGEDPTKHPDFKQVDKEDQVLLDELERLKRQEQDVRMLMMQKLKLIRKYLHLRKFMTILLMAIFNNSSYDDKVFVWHGDFTNLEPVVNVSHIPTSRINSIHPSTLILGDPQSAVQTRSKVTKSLWKPSFL
ncbi:hypothetical protein Tco_1541446 [Tanacetum coccineum]